MNRGLRAVLAIAYLVALAPCPMAPAGDDVPPSDSAAFCDDLDDGAGDASGDSALAEYIAFDPEFTAVEFPAPVHLAPVADPPIVRVTDRGPPAAL